MPCDASVFRRLRAGVLAMAIVSFGLVSGLAFAQDATSSAAPDTAQAAPAEGDAAAPPPAETTEPVADTRGLDEEIRSEEHTSELQSLRHLVCRLLLEKKKT